MRGCFRFAFHNIFYCLQSISIGWVHSLMGRSVPPPGMPFFRWCEIRCNSDLLIFQHSCSYPLTCLPPTTHISAPAQPPYGPYPSALVITAPALHKCLLLDRVSVLVTFFFFFVAEKQIDYQVRSKEPTDISSLPSRGSPPFLPASNDSCKRFFVAIFPQQHTSIFSFNSHFYTSLIILAMAAFLFL